MDSASVWQFAARSSETTTAQSGPNRNPKTARRFRSLFPLLDHVMSAELSNPTVYVVDDDQQMRDSLCALLDVLGFRVKAFATPGSFHRFYRPDMPACLVLDIRMPRQTGLELYELLLEEGKRLPVIFITAHADVS